MTMQAHYQQLRAMGADHETAQREAQLQANYERSLADRAVAQQTVPAEPARPAYDFHDYDELLRREQAHWARVDDPQRAAWHRSEERRLTAEIAALDAQLEPLQQKRRQLVAERNQHLFQG